VADRDEPEASCSKWHGDGTAGKHDGGSGLAVMAPAWAMGEARPGRHVPRWQVAEGGAAAVTYGSGPVGREVVVRRGSRAGAR
jgi:hypothetical protein